jgi:hypothetical protein
MCFFFNAVFTLDSERSFLKSSPMEILDKYDIAILRELQADARLTNAELAAARGPVGRALLAPRACAGGRRLHQGLPRRDRPPQDRPGRAGLRAAGRRPQHRQPTRRWKRPSAQIPEVVACHYISGTGTFELQVVAATWTAFRSLRATCC